MKGLYRDYLGIIQGFHRDYVGLYGEYMGRLGIQVYK